MRDPALWTLARRPVELLAAVILCLLPACAGDEPPAPAAGGGLAPEDRGREGERFTWIRSAPGGWRHVSSPSGEYRLPEIMCGGVVLLDFDSDGDLDVFVVQGGTWPDLPEQAGLPYPGHGLFRNDGDWRFTEVAAEVGLRGEDGSYCLGAVAGDYDSDGDPDLFVTAYGGNRMYRNDGGRFVDATEECGVSGGETFSVSACFFDADQDGHLDLYVVNYLTYSHELNRRQRCGLDTTGVRDYCSPRVFEGAQDFYYHNQGNGRFVEKALEVGLGSPQPMSNHSKGLGVVVTDIENDGDPDLYVANDATANLLFVNDGRGHFEEGALLRNCAFSSGGIPQAGMGVDAGDYDRDGLLDLWVVHLDGEENALYRNLGDGLFADSNRSAQLGVPARGRVGFGTDLLDLDHDGDLDIVIAHGHVLLHAEETRGNITYAQQDQVLLNDGQGHFALLPAAEAGQYFETRTVARGLASGDLDGDGDLDLVIGARDAAPAFLRNNHDAGARPDSLLVQPMVGDRPAIGACVEVRTAAGTQREELRAGHSYASCSAPRLHFGLGAADSATVEVSWPDGRTRRFEDLEAGSSYRLWPGTREPDRLPQR